MDNKIQARRTVTRPFTALALLCLLLSGLGGASRNASADDWWSNLHDYRVPLEVTSGSTALIDKIVTIPIDLTSLLMQAGAGSTTLDVRSLRVLETSSAGTAINAAVPFQFDPAPDFNATSNAVGELVLLMEGSTPSSGRRNFQIYFAAGAALPAPPVLPRISVTDGVIDEGESSFAVRTVAGDWYYHKTSGGFSSLEDRSGNDWIGYSSAAGASGDYRGIPNLVPPASGGYFHPGRPGTAQSSLIDRGPLRARIHSRSADSQWATLWEILPTHATMTVTQAAGKYWFLYEGTPGGTLDLNTDLVVRSNGTQTKASASWKLDIPGEEWAYFADPGIGRSLYVSSHQSDSLIDMYRPMDGAMTIFGLGRDQVNALLSGERRFSVGLVDSTQIGAIAPVVRSASADNVTGTLGTPQSRPQDDQKPVARALANRIAGPVPFTINVNGGTSSCVCGPISTYAWDFGDGGTANGALASHTFAQEGIFTVTLTVTSATGTTSTDHFAVVVGALLPGEGPQAVLKSNVASGSAPLTVELDGTDSTDPDGGTLSYSWDFGDGATASGPFASHTFTQPGTYTVLLTVTDSQGRIGTDSAAINVTPAVGSAPPVFHHGRVENVGEAWKTVALPYAYKDPVVIASVRYPDAAVQPVVTRVRNASGNQFEVRVQNPSDQSLARTYSVDYTVVDAGTYSLAEHGIKMEAVKATSTKTNAKGAWTATETRTYSNSYTTPVVLGQVMSANDADWSVFWARGATKDSPPSPSALSAGKHVGEDTDKTRANEAIGYLVIEAGSGNIGGVAYQAGVSAPIVAGIAAGPYSIALSSGSTPSTAVVSAAGMRGGDGGWPVLFGANPLAAGVLGLAFDEDQITDTERSHGAEQVAYLVLGNEGGGTGNLPPVASFTASPTNGTAPLTVSFNSSASSDVDGTIASRTWSFGDGGTSTAVSPGYTYTAAGTYTATLTVTDNDGANATASKTITVGSAPPPGGTGKELKVFDWNWPVIEDDRGFPKVEAVAKPSSRIFEMLPGSNGDWTSPVDYANGTLHMRVQVNSQPVPQAMKIQFCVWQWETPTSGWTTSRETCTPTANVQGTTGNQVIWSAAIPTMWKKDGKPIVWTDPRTRYGIAIKNTSGVPVTNYDGFVLWAGEDPKEWYPLDARFTVVAVPKGATFSGWSNY
ncbi:PKD domain-containing protein [Thiocapsa roseopersicina]|uniref:PKD domain-containing protein n=1 Tax=Thiocapsa roseopersicina TaxID=1058 RepID=A0A1H2Y5E0_THIRO|nr:PKD domain-containing protein [Thiocapsa roseopersicina]SDX00038.1 PKD domain-containing protein [Thiocapsa roseopersicina]